MTKLRARSSIVEESAVTVTRSSPRRRKRGPSEGFNDLDTRSPASKRVKTQAKNAPQRTDEALKQEAVLIGAQTIVNGHSKASPKRRPRAVAQKVTEARSQREDSGIEAGLLNGDGAETPTTKRKGKAIAKKVKGVEKQESAGEEGSKALEGDTPKMRKRKSKGATIKAKDTSQQDSDLDDSAKSNDDSTPKKVTRKRKTAEEKAAEAMPLAARTTGLRMYVGAHVSIAKGVQNSITNIHHIGGNAFALFLKSQRKWDNPPLTDSSRDAFHSHCHTHNYDASSHILPHGSYLVNLAQEDADKSTQAYAAFIDDLHRCESLGIKLYNFHPGATGSSPLPSALKRIAAHLNTALSATSTVIPVLENMAGSGTVIGSRFSDLRDIIAHIKPEFQDRIGVCIDTCHAFAAGYDLRTPESFQTVLQEFDDVVGLKYLKALHLNDSKAPLGGKRDLHQNIGLGFLGLRAFHNVMNERQFEGLPLILETPCEKPNPEDKTGKKMLEDKGVWAREIKLLEGLIGMDAGSEEFGRLERELSERGRGEREKMLQATEGRERKRNVKVEKDKEKGQRSLRDMMMGGATGGTKTTAKTSTKGKDKDKDKGNGKGSKMKAGKKDKAENDDSPLSSAPDSEDSVD
jgi:AP endonuclease 1